MTSCLLLLFLATKNYAVSCAVSAKNWRVSKNTLCQQKTCWVIKMPHDDSAKDNWVSKNLLTQQKSADSAKYAVSTKFDLSAQIHGDHSAKKYVISTRNLDKSVKWAVSAKIRWVSKICCVSKIYGSVKMPGDDSAKTCCISKNCHLRFENGKRRNRCL